MQNRSRRRKQAVEAVAKLGGMPALVEKLDTLRTHKAAQYSKLRGESGGA
jgi:hypothetical protein